MCKKDKTPAEKFWEEYLQTPEGLEYLKYRQEQSQKSIAWQLALCALNESEVE